MEENLNEVRRQIEQTRVALGEKISRLQDQIETTKNTTLSPSYYFATRPWQSFGLSILVGVILGRVTTGKSKPNSAPLRPDRSRVWRGEMMGGARSAMATQSGRMIGDFFGYVARKRLLKD